MRAADRIYVLEHGAVIEHGTHAQLMQLGGRYAEMFELQASGYLDPQERIATSPQAPPQRR